MERELKFKAWDVQLNKMFDGDQIEESKTIKTYLSYGQLTIGCFPKLKDYYELIPLQFTGMRDKNGKEIYEGDIVKFTRRTENGIESENIEVYFDTEMLEFGLRYCNELFHCQFHDEFELIGNIYETPQLLTVAS